MAGCSWTLLSLTCSFVRAYGYVVEFLSSFLMKEGPLSMSGGVGILFTVSKWRNMTRVNSQSVVCLHMLS